MNAYNTVKLTFGSVSFKTVKLLGALFCSPIPS